MQETWVPSLGWDDPLEKGMATHSSILAWIPSGCLAAQTMRWAEGIRVPAPLAGGGTSHPLVRRNPGAQGWGAQCPEEVLLVLALVQETVRPALLRVRGSTLCAVLSQPCWPGITRSPDMDLPRVVPREKTPTGAAARGNP